MTRVALLLACAAGVGEAFVAPQASCGVRSRCGAASPAVRRTSRVVTMGEAEEPDPFCSKTTGGFGRQSVLDALAELRRGRPIVVTDDEGRENEGDLIIAAEKATPEWLAFIVRYTSGVICVSMEQDRLTKYQLPQMVPNNEDPKQTAFGISVDYKVGTSTGISAADRAATLRALATESTTAEDFSRPGHIFPLRYREGGVLKRAGHTEATVDFCRAAGLQPVGALCEIVNDDGTMSRMPDLKVFAKEHGLVLTTIADLIEYRRATEKLVVSNGPPCRLPTRYGVFDAYGFKGLMDGAEHIAMVMGGPFDDDDEEVLVRVHSECCTGDVLGSLRCDCGQQLEYAMQRVAQEGRGVVLYLRGQEGRGIGLAHKLRAYSLQDKGWDTVEANEKLGLPVDSREYGTGAQILADLGISKMRVLTNNPAKYTGLAGYGLSIVNREEVPSMPNPENIRYLETKKTKMGHLLNLEDKKNSGGKSDPEAPEAPRSKAHLG